MSELEKITLLRTMLPDADPSEADLKALLTISKGAILNRRYPQGYPENTEVPSKYEYLQLQACVQLFNKQGAEGQSSHGENGITRVYEPGDISYNLLKQVLPMAGSVVANEKP
jgi:hypothetical protein